MAPTIAEAVMPLEFPNKEERETDFSPTTEEDGIKEELVARSNLEEFIAQTKPMLRENDEEAYEEAYEEVVTVSKVSSEGKLEIAFAHNRRSNCDSQVP